MPSLRPGSFLVFDVFGDLAHFKKPHTTMSMQTFDVPTGTAVIGMISAILGLDKHTYWESFCEDSYDLAIGLQCPVVKVNIPFNTLKITSPSNFFNIDQHKRSNMEFVKNARYRIWFRSRNQELMIKLQTFLTQHQSVYSLSLGLAWCLADFEYVGTCQPNKDIQGHSTQLSLFESEACEIHSIIPKC